MPQSFYLDGVLALTRPGEVFRLSEKVDEWVSVRGTPSGGDTPSNTVIVSFKRWHTADPEGFDFVPLAKGTGMWMRKESTMPGPSLPLDKCVEFGCPGFLRVTIGRGPTVLACDQYQATGCRGYALVRNGVPELPAVTREVGALRSKLWVSLFSPKEPKGVCVLLGKDGRATVEDATGIHGGHTKARDADFLRTACTKIEEFRAKILSTSEEVPTLTETKMPDVKKPVAVLADDDWDDEDWFDDGILMDELSTPKVPAKVTPAKVTPAKVTPAKVTPAKVTPPPRLQEPGLIPWLLGRANGPIQLGDGYRQFTVRLTPNDADLFIRHRHPRQRPLKPRVVVQISDKMRKGEWRAGSMLKVASENGLLYSGQHRVNALKVSGTPIEFSVQIRSELDMFMDDGRNETAWSGPEALNLRTSIQLSKSAYAGVKLWLEKWEANASLSDDELSTQILGLSEKSPDLLVFANNCASYGGPLVNRATISALLSCYSKHKNLATFFAKALLRRDPADPKGNRIKCLNWAIHYLSDRNRGNKKERTERTASLSSNQGVARDTAAYVITTFNLFVEGKWAYKPKHFEVTSLASFPAVTQHPSARVVQAIG